MPEVIASDQFINLFADAEVTRLTVQRRDQLRIIAGVRPKRWMVSCGGLDRLPGVIILELCRA